MSTFKTVTSSSQVNGNTVETPGQVRKYVAWACAEGCSEIEVMLRGRTTEQTSGA